MASSLIQITPSDLGLPSKFSSWRPGQFEAVETAASSPHPFLAQCAPTGFGKTLFYVAVGMLSGGRTVILTSTKGLQDQLKDDFGESGICDLRGRHNYQCNLDSSHTCADGRLLGCRDTGCPYLSAREYFLQAPLVVTNYAYFLSSIIFGDGCGDIDLLVLDEAHSVLNELSSALEIVLDHGHNQYIYSAVHTRPPYGAPIAEWVSWAVSESPKITQWIAQNKGVEKLGKIRTADQLKRDMGRLATLMGEWILDEQPGKTSFCPLWPTDYAEQLIHNKAKRKLFVSATIVRKGLDLLKVPHESSLFLSTPYTFDSKRAPVYLCNITGPTGRSLRVDFKMDSEGRAILYGYMDNIIGRRLDRKALIHTTSYDRMREMQSNTGFGEYILCPDAKSLVGAIEQLRESAPPRILASPALTTGYNFPFQDAEYAILLKVPFLDVRGPVMKARVASDPEYPHYITAQNLTQTIGRHMRDPKDQGESFILDGHALWFTARRKGGYAHLHPEWFLRLLRYPDGLPPPPPTLVEQGIPF